MPKLKPGDKAPAIDTTDENGKPVSLSDYRGKKVVLYFYPKDDTPSCTKEACSFRDHHKELKKKGYVVLGVSMDTGKSHQKFIKKFELPFTLLSDTERKVIDDYGVWGWKKFMGREYMGIIRTTFVINEKGRIEKIIDKVDTKNAASQILTEA